MGQHRDVYRRWRRPQGTGGRRIAGLVALLSFSLVAGCSDGGDDGDGVVPTAPELYGLWSVVDEQWGATAWRFAASMPEHEDLAGATNVYEFWQYGGGQPQTLVQRGTFEVVGDALRTHVTWDIFYPCAPTAEVCFSVVGGSFSNTIFAFSANSWTLQSKKAAAGKRTYSRVEACPAPLSSGTWHSGLGPVSHGYGAYPVAIADPEGGVHLFASANASGPVRYARRAACGYSVETISPGAAGASHFIAGPAGALFGAYRDLTNDSVVFTERGASGWSREVLQQGYPAAIGLGADGVIHLVVTDPAAAVLRYGRRVGGSWQFEELVAGVETNRSVVGMVVSEDGGVIVLHNLGGAFTRSIRAPTGGWTSTPEAMPCSSARSLQREPGGALVALCADVFVGGGLVPKSLPYSLIRESDGGWTKEPIDTAQLGSLFVDAQGVHHVALLRDGSGSGTTGSHVIVGSDAGGAWRFSLAGTGSVHTHLHDIGLVRDAAGETWVHYGDGRLATSWVTPFEPLSGVLKVARLDGAEGASVRSIPAGIECPGTCEAVFAGDTYVRLLIDFEAPHALNALHACAIRAGHDARHWECRVAIQAATHDVKLYATAAPVTWAAMLAGAGDERVEAIDVKGEIVAAVGGVGGAATFAGSPVAGGDVGSDGLVVLALDAAGAPTMTRALAATRAPSSTRHVAIRGAGAVVVGLTTTAAFTAGAVTAKAAGATLIWLDAAGEVTAAHAIFDAGGGTLRWLRALESGDVLVGGSVGTATVGGEPVSVAGGEDAFVARVSATGVVKWLFVIGTSYDDVAWVDADANGALVGVLRAPGDVTANGAVIESALSGAGSVLFGLSPTGALLWHASNATSGLSSPHRFVRTPDGGAVVCTNSGVSQLHRYGATGETVWELTLPTYTSCVDLAESSDGRTLVTGAFKGPNSPTPIGRLLVVDAAGAWVGDGFSYVDVSSVAVAFGRWAASGDVLVGGVVGGALAFGPLVLPSGGGLDGWLARFAAP